MLLEVVSFLNVMMSDFGAVLIGAVAFWLVYLTLPLFGSRPRRQGHQFDPRVRRFGLPPTRSGGK